MGFLDRLLGREERPEERRPAAGYPAPAAAERRADAPSYGTPPAQSARSKDEIAIERYRYLLRTAPPEAIEQVHREAFEQLTPEQRQQVFRELSEGAPAGDAPRADDAQSLAQSATRSELRQPGFMERRFSGGGAGGMGFGGVLASSMLGTIAGFVIGSAIADAFIPDGVGESVQAEGADGADGGDAGADGGDAGAGDAGGDYGGGDYGGGDFGGGGDIGGGGDFGGGDFGGGFDF
ncbi:MULTISPECIES: hypothetical protein [unclassified Rathayibacter]|uniref:hypothetical protein n=1 Tax=unclassified Rathayibacter TaxID=2609250 RepID=UPI00104B704D|nr:MULTISPECIES: hypothetical protein [unclassified Rathayibacter]TCL80429.1 hypothetical protein EDF49_109147 [Rathayibacter sp. PhB192]TCM25955.1 hypothetical protein EDF43_109147 [Rathayibacter sp. PhB179]